MTDQIPAAAREAARQTVRDKLATLASLPAGYLHDLPPDGIADTALDAAWPAIRERLAQLLIDENPDRFACSDFSDGVAWAADTIRFTRCYTYVSSVCSCGAGSGRGAQPDLPLPAAPFSLATRANTNGPWVEGES